MLLSVYFLCKNELNIYLRLKTGCLRYVLCCSWCSTSVQAEYIDCWQLYIVCAGDDVNVTACIKYRTYVQLWSCEMAVYGTEHHILDWFSNKCESLNCIHCIFFEITLKRVVGSDLKKDCCKVVNVDMLGSNSVAWQSGDLVHCIWWHHCLHADVYILHSATASCLLWPHWRWTLLSVNVICSCTALLVSL